MIKPINITFEENEQKFDAPIFSPDGFSPLAETYRTEGGAILNVTDNRGTTTTTIYDGQQGPIGPAGPQGVSIERIEETQSSVESGQPNTVTVYLSNGAAYNFVIHNGQQGSTGPKGNTGPAGPTGPPGIGLTKAIIGNDGKLYFQFADGSLMVVGNVVGPQGPTGTQGPVGPRGAEGPQGVMGNPGVGIDHITQTTIGSEDESINVITIYLENDENYSFQIKNGSKGTTGSTGATGPQGPRGYGIINTIVGNDGKLYLYFENGTMMVAGYVKGEKGAKGDKGDTGAAGVVEFFEQSTEPVSADAGAFWLDTSV